MEDQQTQFVFKIFGIRSLAVGDRIILPLNRSRDARTAALGE